MTKIQEGYERLIVWQKAMALAREVYTLTDKLPPRERYGLADQMRRAAVSVPSNIAEGNHRGSKKEYVQFLYIARGSLAELETQTTLAGELYPHLETKKASELAEEVGRMLYALARILKA